MGVQLANQVSADFFEEFVDATGLQKLRVRKRRYVYTKIRTRY